MLVVLIDNSLLHALIWYLDMLDGLGEDNGGALACGWYICDVKGYFVPMTFIRCAFIPH